MRVMEMVAVHDLVEIDAGDVSAYNVDASKAVREQAAADRIFALLRPISTSGSGSYGTSSRCMPRRKRGSPTPSIDCSR